MTTRVPNSAYNPMTDTNSLQYKMLYGPVGGVQRTPSLSGQTALGAVMSTPGYNRSLMSMLTGAGNLGASAPSSGGIFSGGGGGGGSGGGFGSFSGGGGIGGGLLQTFGFGQSIQNLLDSLGQNATPVSIDQGSIANALTEARLLREENFAEGALGRADDTTGKQGTETAENKLTELLNPDSAQQQALRDLARRNQDQLFRTALRNQRSLASDRNIPTEVASAQKADLIRERLRARADFEQGLMANELQRQQQAATSLGNLSQNSARTQAIRDQLDIAARRAEAEGRTGNPELSAQILAQIKLKEAELAQSAQNARQQLASSVLGQLF